MKLQELQLFGVEDGEQNSCVVFDIPSESRTILPLALGAPEVSSATTAWARDCPAVACAVGSTLPPAGYKPPTNPLYVAVPSSVSGIRVAVAGPVPFPL